jgi:hypothetical protein
LDGIGLLGRIYVAAILGFALALAVWAVVALYPWPRHGADRVRHAIRLAGLLRRHLDGPGVFDFGGVRLAPSRGAHH